MKKQIVLASLLISGVANADSTKTIGIDGGVAVPTGDWSDAVGFGIGALARFEMPIKDKITFTARAGYIQHLEKEGGGDMFGGESKSSAAEIPFFGGLRYAFKQEATTAIYGAAELGFVMYRVSVDIGGMESSDSDTNLGMSLGAGYRTGKLDLRGALWFPDVGEAGDAMAVMATVGYDITSL
jgi:hypothetical protein